MKTPLNFQFGMIFGFAISLTTICSLMLLDRWKAQKLDLYFGLGIGILFIILSLIFLYSQNTKKEPVIMTGCPEEMEELFENE